MGVFSICISRLSIRLRTKLFQSYLRQEIGFFDTHESGKLLSRLNHDTQVMSSTVANNIAQFIGALVKFSKFPNLLIINEMTYCFSLFSWYIYNDD
jgi:ABC-type multidrug transport system fused ATPase/permease subunit